MPTRPSSPQLPIQKAFIAIDYSIQGTKPRQGYNSFDMLSCQGDMFGMGGGALEWRSPLECAWKAGIARKGVRLRAVRLGKIYTPQRPTLMTIIVLLGGHKLITWWYDGRPSKRQYCHYRQSYCCPLTKDQHCGIPSAPACCFFRHIARVWRYLATLQTEAGHHY